MPPHDSCVTHNGDKSKHHQAVTQPASGWTAWRACPTVLSRATASPPRATPSTEGSKAQWRCLFVSPRDAPYRGSLTHPPTATGWNPPHLPAHNDKREGAFEASLPPSPKNNSKQTLVREAVRNAEADVS